MQCHCTPLGLTLHQQLNNGGNYAGSEWYFNSNFIPWLPDTVAGKKKGNAQIRWHRR